MRSAQALLALASCAAPAASQEQPRPKLLRKDGGPPDRARAATLAICLGEGERLRKERPEDWKSSLEELKMFPKVLRQIYDAPQPQGSRIQAAARAEGLEKPGK
jgi:predicted secreted protein